MGLSITSACVLCGDFTRESISLCSACQNDLPKIETACQRCGLPVSLLRTPSNIIQCGDCLAKSPAVDYTFSLYHYESPVDYLIKQLKFQQQLPYASIMASLLLDFLIEKKFEDDFPEVIIPVPLHNKRLRKRGFNQSLEISRIISKRLKLSIDYALVSRIRATRAQSELTAKEREKNIKGCFEVNKTPPYKHVVLVDDVVTTGVTTNELARILKDNGVEKVGVWSIARAL